MRERHFRWVKYIWATQFTLMLLCVYPISVHAEPISFSLTTFLIGLAVSAATTAAQLLLAHVLAPKPKPIDKDKLSGDIRITAIGEDVPIPEIYGGMFLDGLGGIKHGGVVIWASQIRKVVVTVPGGGGGGKGAPRAAPQREHHYYQDYAVLVGRGQLEVLQIDANTDVIYTNTAQTPSPPGVSYEAEGGATLPPGVTVTLAGSAAIVSDGGASNGQKVTGVGNTGTITWNNVQVDIASLHTLYICYKNNVDGHEIRLEINAEVYPMIPLPNTYNAVRNVQLVVSMLPGVSNSIKLSNPVATADIDRIVIMEQQVEIANPPHEAIPLWPPSLPYENPMEPPQLPNTNDIPRNYLAVSGVKYPGYVNPTPTYNNLSLVDPLTVDTRPLSEWNFQPHDDADGQIESVLPNMAIRIYPGTATQQPDPLLQSYFHPIYGSGSCPAYRHRTYVVIENMEITKYSALMPNFTFRTQNPMVRDLGNMFKTRAKMAGLQDSEMNFTALTDIPLRGVAIMQKQSPATDMAHLNRIYDTDVYEDVDGIITGVIPSETVIRQIPLEELQVKEGYKSTEGDKQLPQPVVSIIRDEYQLPQIFSVGFFDVGNAFEPTTISTRREYTVSDRHETFDTQIALSRDEGKRFADRELQKLYAEKDALSLDTFYKHGDLTPTQLIEVQQHDGTYSKMRVKAIEGWIPGPLTFQGVSRNLIETAPRVHEALPPEVMKVERPNVPGNVIGTLIDVATLRTAEYETGIYVAACLTNQAYRWRGAALIVEKEEGYEKLFDIHKQSIIGRTIAGAAGVLPPATGGFGGGESLIDPNEAVELQVDLFCGELVSVDAVAVENDRANAVLIGNELCHYRTATPVSGFPNRWLLTGIYRRAKGTSDAGHASGDRVVVFDNTVRWISMDASEYNKTRNYKFVGAGQDFTTVWSTSFTYQGNTTQTSNNTVSVATNYTVKLRDGIVLVDASGGNRTITLPEPAVGYEHESFTIKKTDSSANTVTVISVGSAQVDGASSFVLAYQFESIDVYAKNDNWWVR